MHMYSLSEVCIKYVYCACTGFENGSLGIARGSGESASAESPNMEMVHDHVHVATFRILQSH